MWLPFGKVVLICAVILASTASAARASLAASSPHSAGIAKEALDFNDIVLGPDGALWVAEYNNGIIGRFTPGGPLSVFATHGKIVPFSQHADRTRLALRGHLTQYPLPDRSSQPAQITVGPDRALWFTEFFAGKIGRITTNGRLTEIPLPRLTGSKSQMRRNPWGITAGPDGNLWFTDSGVGMIGRITPGGQLTEFSLPPIAGSGNDLIDAHGPMGITAGPDGNLWFTEYLGNRIGRITPRGRIAEFLIPTGRPDPNATSSPWAITSGPDGNLWFTERYADKIGRVTVRGRFAEFALPGARPGPDNSLSPSGITVGPDKNLWFVEWAGNHIGRLSPSGAMHLFTLPWPEIVGESSTYGSPNGITRGADGTLWFAEMGGIGQITPAGRVTVFRAAPPVPLPPGCPDPAC